jgi:hypothetical protein
MNDRDRVIESMIAVHLVSRELAEQWAAKMDDKEIGRRIAMYARIEDERAGKELSAVGAKTRADLISTRFLDPRQRRHASRHSTPFPSSRPNNEAGESLPELEAKNRVRVRIAR